MPSVASSPTAFEISCECGRLLTVTAGQAGSQIQCECGKVVEVPTIRELRKQYERVGAVESKVVQRADPRAAQDEFSRTALTVAAIGLIVGGLVIFGSLFLFQRSIKDQEIDPQFTVWYEKQKEAMDKVPPAEVWVEWAHARDSGLGEHHPFEVVENKNRAMSAWSGAYFGLGASGVGLVLLIFSALIPRRKLQG